MIDLNLNHLFIVFQLIILEGLLSFDNALALAALVKKKLKEPEQQKKALLLGIWGAYLFRIGIIFIGVWLMKYEWVKAIAGLYLLYLSCHELFFHKETTHEISTSNNIEKIVIPKSINTSVKHFILVVVQVEIMDIMFSIDSIAVALAISDVKWVLISGALLGVLLMRIAAQFFIKLIEKFPILEKTAFVLVGIAGINVILKIKDLNLGFSYLTIDKPIPENIFLLLMVFILLGSLFFNKTYVKKNHK
ncbi:TerC family protein [Pigmentibacter ruber]|uniref:TerC family protein n=1 Tax=Pigmentibacter ruber TaxID=2683196 RepID=UPI00131B2179|nr:hypothetical protein [Pigmentibacter ruber]BFD31637.1 TerC family protein [Pigmentibacter ruber]